MLMRGAEPLPPCEFRPRCLALGEREAGPAEPLKVRTGMMQISDASWAGVERCAWKTQ